VPVRVHSWTVRERSQRSLDVTISCTGGTYVRALARDLGRAAGSAAHLTALRRTRSGPFDIGDATDVSALQKGEVVLAPLRAAVPQLTIRRLEPSEVGPVLHGNAIPAVGDAPLVALVDDGDALVALAARDGESLRPRVVLRDA
jgi:tRNA pseudouridine55 synthase